MANFISARLALPLRRSEYAPFYISPSTLFTPLTGVGRLEIDDAYP